MFEERTPFRQILPEDREWITACRDPRQNPFTVLSFASLFSWAKPHGYTIAGDRDFFVIRSGHDRAYYAPCGDEAKCRRFTEEIIRREKHPRFLYLTEEQALELKRDGFQITARDDLSEYLFDVNSLALREGAHATNSYKMKVRHFHRDVSFTVRPVTKNDLPLLADIARDGLPALDAEFRDVFRTEIEFFEELGMEGRLMETDKGERAFMIGYRDSAEVFTMDMTKHDAALPAQVTAVMVHAIARSLPETIRLVNLEEDVGLAGLRKAKQLYTPVKQLIVYEAIL